MPISELDINSISKQLDVFFQKFFSGWLHNTITCNSLFFPDQFFKSFLLKQKKKINEMNVKILMVQHGTL